MKLIKAVTGLRCLEKSKREPEESVDLWPAPDSLGLPIAASSS